LAIVPLDGALVTFYRLSIVTVLLTEAVWPKFAMQIFGSIPGVQSVPSSRMMGNWYHKVAIGQTDLLPQTVLSARPTAVYDYESIS